MEFRKPRIIMQKGQQAIEKETKTEIRANTIKANIKGSESKIL